MKRGTARLLSLLAGPLCAVALVAPAAAAHGPSTPGVPPAWAKWSPPPTPKATPSALAGFFNSGASSSDNMSYNSSGGTVTSTQTGTGAYKVDFAGLGGITGGNAEITTVNATATCAVAEWYPSGADLLVYVDCYDYTGNAYNSDFSLIVTQPTGAAHGALAYDWNYKLAKSYTPTGGYQYNSKHKRNHITHLGTGRYKVTMPGVGTTGRSGTVKVSAYGTGGGDCQLDKWKGTASHAEEIWVDCFSATGARQDREFDVVYAKANNLMGQNGMISANALADQPGVSAYLPRTQWVSRRGANVDIIESLQPKVYDALLTAIEANGANLNGGGGNLQLTPQGSSYVHCLTVGWSAEFTVTDVVGCVNNSGRLVKAAYTIQWVSR